jgi:hypothetical protein
MFFFFVTLQQKLLIKSDDDDDDDVDIQNNQSVATSFDIQGHEVCVPTACSVKTEPEVGPVSLCVFFFFFCNSYSCMLQLFFVVVVQVIHNMKQNLWIA